MTSIASLPEEELLSIFASAPMIRFLCRKTRRATESVESVTLHCLHHPDQLNRYKSLKSVKVLSYDPSVYRLCQLIPSSVERLRMENACYHREDARGLHEGLLSLVYTNGDCNEDGEITLEALAELPRSLLELCVSQPDMITRGEARALPPNLTRLGRRLYVEEEAIGDLPPSLTDLQLNRLHYQQRLPHATVLVGNTSPQFIESSILVSLDVGYNTLTTSNILKFPSLERVVGIMSCITLGELSSTRLLSIRMSIVAGYDDSVGIDFNRLPLTLVELVVRNTAPWYRFDKSSPHPKLVELDLVVSSSGLLTFPDTLTGLKLYIRDNCRVFYPPRLRSLHISGPEVRGIEYLPTTLTSLRGMLQGNMAHLPNLTSLHTDTIHPDMDVSNLIELSTFSELSKDQYRKLSGLRSLSCKYSSDMDLSDMRRLRHLAIHGSLDMVSVVRRGLPMGMVTLNVSTIIGEMTDMPPTLSYQYVYHKDNKTVVYDHQKEMRKKRDG